MRNFIRIVFAEAAKQHRNYFHSKTIYISLFVWPFLNFVTAYFGYMAFDFDEVGVSYITKENILIYILLGYMCLNFFTSLVQSAWIFSNERTSGTLELVFLSPANRFAVILGNAISSLFESVVVMVIFAGLIFAVLRNQMHMFILPVLIVVIFLCLIAVLWGVFLNALFLYSRDSGFLFTILESPMEIFAGVKVPVALFPAWAKVISAIFPLTYVMEAIRSAVLNGTTLGELWGFVGRCLIITSVLLATSMVVLKCVENHVRRTGNLNKF